MHPTKYARHAVLWGLLVFGGMSGTAAFGQEQPAPLPRPSPAPKVDKTGALIVPIQGSVRIQMKTKQPIRDVFNERENVLTVLPDAADPTRVVLLGRAVGITRVTLTDINNKQETYEIVVQPDIELLRKLITQAVPTANIQVVPGVGSVIILTGNVAHTSDVDTILRLASSIGGGADAGNIINAMNVGGVAQVQLDVVVAQVSRNEARNRGFSFGVQGTEYVFSSILGGLGVPGAGGGGAAGGFGPLQAGGAANIVFARVQPTTFQTFLQALKSEGVAKILNEPKLVTQSGRVARFLAGGRQAVLGPASGINGPGVVYEEFGTELEFLPLVYGNGKIYLEVAPRIRNVNQSLGITTSFGTVPGFDEQSVRTSVLMEDGQTFAIGGLISSNVQSQTTKVPFVGELPFIGTLFSTITQTESEQELVILVTVRLVDPQDCSQVNTKLPGRETRSATDFELYLEGIMEAPRGQRVIFENGKYKAAYKNSPTAAQYPCLDANCGGGRRQGGANCADGSCPTGPTNGVMIAPQPQGQPLPQGAVPNLQPTPIVEPFQPNLGTPNQLPGDVLPNPLNPQPMIPTPMMPINNRGVELPRPMNSPNAIQQTGYRR